MRSIFLEISAFTRNTIAATPRANGSCGNLPPAKMQSIFLEISAFTRNTIAATPRANGSCGNLPPAGTRKRSHGTRAAGTMANV